MPILIGTDEAGYGPNLGPLVITATSWSVPEDFSADKLWNCLADVVSQRLPKACDQLHVADSKQVYSASGSIEPLELSAMTFLSLPHATPLTVRMLGSAVAAKPFCDNYANEPWNNHDDFAVPVMATVDRIASFRDRLSDQLDACGVRLNSIRSRVLFPAEFNDLVDSAGTKGQVLSAATLRLVRQAVDEVSEPPIGHVICDKHGGRNRYDGLIADAFDDQFVFRLEESRAISRYRLQDLEFCFRTRAEAALPVALASIVSKYLREVLMMQFNQYWQQLVPGLKPTKGYPVDARRFWQDISSTVETLRFNERDLWRQR